MCSLAVNSSICIECVKRVESAFFCDGARGNLTKQLERRLQLGNPEVPEMFALGIKEL